MLLRARDLEIDLSGSPLVVGVVNATPDSFSDAGSARSLGGVLKRAEALLEAGADVIEVGGESNVSNRPPVSVEEECERIAAPVEEIASWGVPVAIDTYKPPVAQVALEAGARIVNDISGFADPAMAKLCARTGAAAVIVHTETPPKVSRWDPDLYPDGVVAHVRRWLADAAARLEAAGVDPRSIVLDPGPDFAKTPRQTVELLAGLDEIVGLGYAVMLASSRKDFIGALTKRRPSERLGGSLAAVAHGAAAGVHMLRVHDVRETRDFLTVRAALRNPGSVDPALRVPEEVRRERPAERYETRLRL